MPIDEIYQRFDFIFKEFDFDSFFKFGVIRDPLNWVVSWYNYRARSELADPSNRNHKRYTGNMKFSDFWEINKGPKYLPPQSNRFFSKNKKKIKVDYLCRLESLKKDLAVVEKILGIDSLNMIHKNKSIVRKIAPQDVNDKIRMEIKKKYKDDYECIKNLDGYNTDGLDRFKSRESYAVRQQDGFLRKLKNSIMNTPFDPPIRSVINTFRKKG